MSFNPWSNNDSLSGISLGDPSSGLMVARTHGVLQENSASNVDRSPSLQLVTVLRELSDVRAALDEVEHSLYCYQLDQSVADLTHSNSLESRLKQLDGLLTHFTKVTANRHRLLSALQSTSTADHSLKMAASHHRSAVEVVASLDAVVTNITTHCQRLARASSLHVTGTSSCCLDGSLRTLLQCLVECRTRLQSYSDLHHTMHGGHQ